MEVIKPGSHVYLNGEIKAFINSVTISLGEPIYNCAWWNGAEYRTGDFFRKEFSLKLDHSTLNIGFGNAESH